MKAFLFMLILSATPGLARVGDTVVQLQKRFPAVRAFGGTTLDPIYECRNEKWSVICVFRRGVCVYERYEPVGDVQCDRATVEKVLLTMSDGKIWEAEKGNPPLDDYRSRRQGKWSIGTTQAVLDNGNIHIYSPLYLTSTALQARRNGVYGAHIFYDPEEKKEREARQKADPAKGL